MAWAIAAILLLATIELSVRNFVARTPALPEMRFEMTPPDGIDFGGRSVPLRGDLALSPDGRNLVFVGAPQGRATSLWVRSLDATDSRELPGTENAALPFWSPDSRFVGFFVQQKLFKIDITGGPPQLLCETGGEGGTWNRDGVILFGGATTGGISRVSAAGGPVTAVTSPPEGGVHRHPYFLPDGHHFLFLAQEMSNVTGHDLSVGDLNSSATTRVLNTDGKAVYSDGYLLFLRQGILWAQPFNVKSLQLSGEPRRLAEQVRLTGGNGRAALSVSDTGVLGYRKGTSGVRSELAWIDQSGRKQSALTEIANFIGMDLSPDDSKVAVHKHEGATGDLWIYELSRGAQTRFTSHPSHNLAPVWSPDGSRIAFDSDRNKPSHDIFLKPANGGNMEELLIKTNLADSEVTDWSRDDTMIYMVLHPKNKWDLEAFSFRDRKSTPIFETEFNEMWGRLSPDGRWIAYQSDETRTPQIYVRHFPPDGAKVPVSTNGGRLPVWSPSGNEIYFLDPANKLMTVDIKTGPNTVQAGVSKVVAELRITNPGPTPTSSPYSLSKDGKRFLFIALVGDTANEPLSFILNWRAQLEK